MRPAFWHKHMLEVRCGCCAVRLSRAGMDVRQLADSNDGPDMVSVGSDATQTVVPIDQPVDKIQCMCMCTCVACRACGSVVGYQVMLPCVECLRENTNGHLIVLEHAHVTTRLQYMEEVSSGVREYLTWGNHKH